MSTTARVTGYGAVLALLFGGAYAVGTAVGPIGPVATAGAATAPGGGAIAMSGMDGMAGMGGTAGGDLPAVGPGVDSAGLSATAAGYTLVPRTTELEPGRPGEYAFTITGPDGAPVGSFDTRHDQEVPLSVVRRDAAGYQELDAVRGPDGVWRAPVTLPTGGVYRVVADIAPTGGPLVVLGADLFAPGEFVPVPPLQPSRVAEVDGYRVRLDGDLVAGRPSQVFATVSRDGRGVTDLEPHHGAFGHLVALRAGDLAHLPVHPDTRPTAPTDRVGPALAFTAEVPTAGPYRLVLTFRHAGGVHTAEFQIDVPA